MWSCGNLKKKKSYGISLNVNKNGEIMKILDFCKPENKMRNL